MDLALEQVPQIAYQTTRPATQRCGYTRVWYGSDPPLYPLPEIPAAERDRPEFRPLRFSHRVFNSTPRILENNHDEYHRPILHKLPAVSGWLSLTLDRPSDEYSVTARFGTGIEAKLKAHQSKHLAGIA
jgi:phenylpropionate dioxygenase-like ring-hydroxylating dioxygenase large terminal subunit